MVGVIGTLGVVVWSPCGGDTLGVAGGIVVDFVGKQKIRLSWAIALFVAVPSWRNGVAGWGRFKMSTKFSTVAANLSLEEVFGIWTCWG